MQKILLILLAVILCTPVAMSQDEDEMMILEAEEGEKKVIADGYGATAEEALQSALQNAVEQAAGAYVSSITEIENDEIVKDEVLSLSHGFIKEHRKLSESRFDNEYKVVVAAIIVEKQIIERLEASGIKVNYNASGLVSDLKAWDNMKENEYKMAKALFDVHEMKNYGIIWNYNMRVGEPQRRGNNYTVKGTVSATTNPNYSTEFFNLKNILSELALETEEMKYQMPVAHSVSKNSKETIAYNRYAFKIMKRKRSGKVKEATKFIDIIVPIVEPEIVSKNKAYGRRSNADLKFYGVNEMTGLMALTFKKYEKELSTQDKNRINEDWLNRYNIIFDFYEKDFSPYMLVLTEGENVFTDSKVVTFYKFMNPETLEVVRNYITFLFESAHCKVVFNTNEEGLTYDYVPDAFFAQYAEIDSEVWSTNADVAYRGVIFNKLPALSFQFEIEKEFTEEEFNKITEIEVEPFKGEQWMK
ncbi:MAG: hypothetical protein ACLFPE_12105 [Bacteroidales bacterium]